MQDFRTTAHVRTIDPRPARPVVPIRPEADRLLNEHAVAFARLVHAALATAPDGELGEPAASHDIADPRTRRTIGGALGLPDHVVRTLTRVFNEAADRLLFADDDLTAVMDVLFPPTARPQLVSLAGGAR